MRSYVLSPYHHGGKFNRTIRVAGREPRLVQFTVDGTVELDAKEAEFMAQETALGWIGLKGVPFEKPETPNPPRLDPSEDYRDFAADDREDRRSESWLRYLVRRSRALNPF